MQEEAKYDLFISYRRAGGVDYARMIYLELKGRGYNTFFDYNSLRSGKFNEGIFKAIDECRYFILVLSEGALDRCMNEDDWVRHEIEYALSKGKEIIPICPSGNKRHFPAIMPESFEPLRNIQISQLLMDDLFDKSFDKIVEDRFDEEFRRGRSPVQIAGGVTSKLFKRIGVGVIAAIIVAAVIVGVATIKSRDAEKVQVDQTRQISEKMLTQATEEKKAAEEAMEKARQEAVNAQKEQARLEAQMKAKEETERELRLAREAKIRAEAEADVVKKVAIVPKEDGAIKKLLSREAEIKARLLPLQDQESSLKKELKKKRQAMLYSVAGGEEHEREESNNRRDQDGLEAQLRSVEEDVFKLSRELKIVQETITRTKATDDAYKSAANAGLNKSILEKTKADLDRAIACMVARRVMAESLGDQVDSTFLTQAKQLEAIAAAERGSLVDALEKTKAADDAYAEILDKVIERKIGKIMAGVESAPEYSKWQTATRLLRDVLKIDTCNERVKKALREAAGHANPSMTVTASLNGELVPEVRFYADSKLMSTPFHYVFETGDRSVNNKLCFLDAVYAKDGKVYSARRYGTGHNWLGETNIVLNLHEIPAAGASIRLKMGRYPQSIMNWAKEERDVSKEVYIDLVWCPPGSEVIKYIDPGSDEEKSVVKSVDVGFWISKYELTGHQYNVLVSRSLCKKRDPFIFRAEPQPDDDFPATVSYFNFMRGLRSIPVKAAGGPIFGDQAILDTPSAAQWIHAAFYGGNALTEDGFSDYAWCMENSGTNASFRVGLKKPTRLGLFDVFGNVPEWVDGTPYEWLGVWKNAEDSHSDYITKMGGGCSDDFETSTDLLSRKPCYASSSGEQGKGGFRLIARSVFEHENSLIEWVKVADMLDSGDPSIRANGMTLLAKHARESADSVMREKASREFVARGGNPSVLNIPLTPEIRREMVYGCTNETELARFVIEDEDQDVKEEAYSKMKTPSGEVSARYLVGVKEDVRANEVFARVFIEKKALNNWRVSEVPKEGIDEELFIYLAINAQNANIRVKALCGVKDSQVLKEIALKDDNLLVVYKAIEKLDDRALLTEIRQKTKKKNVRLAVRDRLEKLSE